jgi:hypothetical protein
MRKLGFLTAFVVVIFVLMATAGTAWAQPPMVVTEVSTFSDSFSGPLDFDCQHELYAVSASGSAVLHFTLFEETGAFHLIFVDQGKAVAVPLDGTGPTYTAKFSDKDLENIRAVRHGDVLVETDTDLIRTVAHGSDGSTAFVTLHAHFTVNANGGTTVQFETDKLVCA